MSLHFVPHRKHKDGMIAVCFGENGDMSVSDVSGLASREYEWFDRRFGSS